MEIAKGFLASYMAKNAQCAIDICMIPVQEVYGPIYFKYEVLN